MREDGKLVWKLFQFLILLLCLLIDKQLKIIMINNFFVFNDLTHKDRTGYKIVLPLKCNINPGQHTLYFYFLN